MRRRTVVVNSVLGVAVLGVAAAAGLSISSAGAQQAPTGQTVAVQRGTVTVTVSATGNVQAGTSVAVAMSGTASGTVRKIYVREGQPVAKGTRLLKVDDTSARRSLRTARASLASAEGQLKTATQGRSAADQQVDDASVRSAETALANARAAADHAEQTYTQDKLQQHSLVSAAEDVVHQAEGRLSDDRRLLETAQAAGDQSRITTLQTAVATDESTVTSAKASRRQAKQARDKALLADRQAIQTANGQVAAARDTVASQTAQRAANAQPPRQGSVESAQSSVDSAQVSVDTAESDLASTTLRAPLDGTVVNVSAVVGESSSAAGGASGAAGSSGSSGSAGAGASGSGGSGSSGSGSASSSGATSSGLVTLATTNAKLVSASVAEADVVKVKVGQSSSVSFPASGRTLSGRVSSVAAESTVTSNVVQYAVDVSLPTAGPSIRLGQTADVTITTARHRDTLYVPTSALSSANGHTTVTRRTAGTDAVVEVQTGLVGSIGTEVVRGLNVGDLLVLPTGTTNQSYTFPGGGASSAASASPSGSGTPR